VRGMNTDLAVMLAGCVTVAVMLWMANALED
jgi:predicted tellurium resistance membrane protein TerC